MSYNGFLMNAAERSTKALNLILEHFTTSATPAGKRALAVRSRRASAPLPNDHEMMRLFCVAISYSQGARSSQVASLVNSTVFRAAFSGFDSKRLAASDPERILRDHWNELSDLRFRGKIRRIVRCAQVLNDITNRHGKFSDYLLGFNIPQRIRTEADIDRFWLGFDALQGDLRARGMPFFRSTTSLLQILLDLDFDSIKPDLIVMRLVRRIRITPRETGDRTLRHAVRALQTFSVRQHGRAAALDLAMLAFGGQSQASKLLSTRFCPPKDPCVNSACLLWANRLCTARN